MRAPETWFGVTLVCTCSFLLHDGAIEVNAYVSFVVTPVDESVRVASLCHARLARTMPWFKMHSR